MVGFGYILLVVYIAFIVMEGIEFVFFFPVINVLPLMFVFFKFTERDFIYNENNPSIFITKTRLFGFIPIEKRHPFMSFNNYVIRVIKKKYAVNDLVVDGMNDSYIDNEYWAIVARNKKNREIEEICKGNRKELDEVITKCIHPRGIVVYVGAPKRGYEYQVKK